MRWMFYGCSSLEKLSLSAFDTSNVNYMKSMFYECSSLKELDLSNFNTSKVTSMNFMFSGCDKLIGNVTTKDEGIKKMYGQFIKGN